jgi:hypothetical protein
LRLKELSSDYYIILLSPCDDKSTGLERSLRRPVKKKKFYLTWA